jgi:hypothetical protein
MLTNNEVQTIVANIVRSAREANIAKAFAAYLEADEVADREDSVDAKNAVIEARNAWHMAIES